MGVARNELELGIGGNNRGNLKEQKRGIKAKYESKSSAVSHFRGNEGGAKFGD